MLNVLNITQPNPIEDIEKILFNFHKGKYGIYHCENIVTFDIETTTSFIINGKCERFDKKRYDNDEDYRKMIDKAEPISNMYCWQMAVSSVDGNIYVFFGRTWYEFHTTLRRLTREAKRQAIFGFSSKDRVKETLIANQINNSTLKMYIFSHNMSFEFQHLRNLYEDKFLPSSKGKQRVFARNARKPMKVNFNLDRKIDIELRDSFVLTQKSLANWCKDEKLPVSKCAPIDYEKLRHSETYMSQTEIQYCINDVVSMIYGLDKFKEQYGFIENIPLTQTGTVRRKVCANLIQNDPEWCEKQCEIMKKYDYDFFDKLIHLFQGGWTHGNQKYIGKVLGETEKGATIAAYDFASSYPAVMTTAKFPVEEFVQCDVSEFDSLASQDVHNADYRWFAKIRFTGGKLPVRCKTKNTYWSLSKCRDKVNDKWVDSVEGVPVVDNGRIKAVSGFTAYMSDLDFDVFSATYKYDNIEVLELYKSKAGYLSKALILQTLEYYGYKTSLKLPEDDPNFNPSLYKSSKEFCNSIYGMMALKILSCIIEFSDENEYLELEEGWNKTQLDVETGTQMLFDAQEKMKPETTYGAYQLAIWVSGWARHRLWDFIRHFDERMIYADTDSIKILNFTDEDKKWIDDYNASVASLEARVASELGFDDSLYAPLNPEGKSKRLGIMAREENIIRFRTWGAKRYAMELEDGSFVTTIAGLPKKAGKNKLHSVDEFENDTVWNTEESLKNTAVYCDHQSNAIMVDDDGIELELTDQYGIALVPTTFDMSIAPVFDKFLTAIEWGDIDTDDDFFGDVPLILR